MLLLALFWTAYFALHSLLAAGRLKAAAARRWPAAGRFYRLGYNLISVAAYLLLLRYQRQLPETWLLQPNFLLTGLGYTLLAAGLLLAAAGLRGYELGEFVGWAYLRRGPAAAEGPLRTQGLNRLMRHPQHFGFGVAVLGCWLLAPTAACSVFGLSHLLYLAVGTGLEERRLARRFGEAYRQYRAQVPLLPFGR